MEYQVLETPVGYDFHGGAAALLESKHPEIIVSGPYETGKTLAALYKLHMLCIKYPGSRSLMIRSEYQRLIGSAYETYQKILTLPLDHVLSPVKPYGGLESPSVINYWNGSKIRLGGLNDPTKVLSSEYDWIYVNQAEELTLEMWEQLISRCTGRAQNAPYFQIFGDCNPDAEHHWIRHRKEILLVEQLHRHNPWLCAINPDHPHDDSYDEWTAPGKVTRTRLQTLSGLRYQRGWLNKWVGAEGIVFNSFSKDKHVLSSREFNVNPQWYRFISVDFGFTHPFVAQWWAVDPNRVMYMYREIYMTHRQISAHAELIRELSSGENIRYIVADPSRPDHIEALQGHGFKVQPAMRDVSLGIQLVQDRLRLGADDRAGIYFLSPVLVEEDVRLRSSYKPKCTIDSLTSIVWKSRSKMTGSKFDEEPLKQNDDGADATRYAVASQDAAVPIADRLHQGSVKIGANRDDDRPTTTTARTRVGKY